MANKNLSKKDMDVIVMMLSSTVSENMQPAIRNSCAQVVKHFLTSIPNPPPSAKAEFKLTVEVPMEIVYQILDKLGEFYGHGSGRKQVNLLHKHKKNSRIEDFR